VTLAGLCLSLVLGASAGTTPAAKAVGTVVKATSKVSPGSDGPVLREGTVTIAFAPSGDERTLKATAKTKVTLDGKPAKFKALLPGTIVLRIQLEGAKTLNSIDLKSAPKAAGNEAGGASGPVSGEVANTDVLKNTISVRIGRALIRDYAVADGTRIARMNEDKSTSLIGLEAIQVGDAVDVQSTDGTTAAEILVRPAR
jgi:hypothetical protein